MRRRSRGGNATKTRAAKTSMAKRRTGQKAVHPRNFATAGHETEVARLTRELNEASERQTATAELLSLIASSPSHDGEGSFSALRSMLWPRSNSVSSRHQLSLFSFPHRRRADRLGVGKRYVHHSVGRKVPMTGIGTSRT